MNSADIPGDLPPQPLILKLVLLGWHGVGKTSFLTRFHEGMFSTYQPSIGFDFRIHKVVKEERECKYQIWDLSGSERFRVITQSYYRGARGLLIFVDLSIETPIVEQLDSWLKDSEKHCSDNVCKFLIGTCENYAQQYNMTFFKTSAKADVNITEAMESIMESVFQQAKDQNFQNVQVQLRHPNPIQGQGYPCC
ncbi:hypothetical protein FGO68_gene12182 [Halteria grandinella]|uniref:Uncharacterized protein n=1 Tax=Halteria grandinella TaxID=5974 RepID=A0A8J8NJ07_HALGN|nr:hypothetical protein FGO68_gene12182 [Halteria grandinella]